MTKNKNDPEVIDITPFIRKRKALNQRAFLSRTKESHLYDIVDALVKLSIALDSIGQYKYGNKVSDLVEEMFTDKSITPQMWGWDSEDP